MIWRIFANNLIKLELLTPKYLNYQGICVRIVYSLYRVRDVLTNLQYTVHTPDLGTSRRSLPNATFGARKN